MKSDSHVGKITFGVRGRGRHKKRRGPKESKSKEYRGQGRG